MAHFTRKALRGSGFGVAAAALLMGCSAPSQKAETPATQASAIAEPANDGSAKRLRVLTEAQYLNTLAHVFGPDVKTEPHFPPAQRYDGLLALGSARGGVGGAQLELYQKAAVVVAGLITNPERRGYLMPCKPADEKAADRACANQFLAYTGRLLSRGALTPTEIAGFTETASTSAASLKDFYAGLGIALEAMLVSPKILFVAERAEPDPKAPGQMRLDAVSLATRLSLFLWNAAPDDAVLKAAESGEILTPKGRARVVNMMLASPRIETGMRAFFDDMFAFDDFSTLAKDPKIYPAFTGVTAQDAREETLRTVIDHLITKNGDYRDLFTTRETFISPALAAMYKLPAPPNWTPYTFPEGAPRSGILTQISFLAVHSHPGRSSPTLRGKALREILLCQPVPSPPPNVDFSAVENPNSPIKTARERINIHQKNPACAGCHKIMDPMGLALENFDSVGRYRDTEKGEKIDASGTLDGKPFQDVVGLGKVLHDHPSLTSCLVKRAYSYSTGQPTKPSDKEKLEFINARFAASGYKLPDLLRTITLSNAFSRIIETPAPAKTASADVAGATAK